MEFLITKTIGVINSILFLIHPNSKEIYKNKNVSKIIKIYNESNYTSNFVLTRFCDAPFITVEKMLPKKGRIIDLGCGEGVFTNFLAGCSKARKVTGIDIDKRRVNQAKKGFSNVEFIHGDVTQKDIPVADAVVMFHLLHHLKSFKDQERLIEAVKGKIRKNGLLVIVEVNPEFSLKYLAAWFTDHFLVPWLFEKRFYSPIFFRKSYDWVRLLKKNNFICNVINAGKGMPFSHIIFVCKRSNYFF